MYFVDLNLGYPKPGCLSLPGFKHAVHTGRGLPTLPWRV